MGAASAAGRAPVLVVLHVLHVAARPHKVAAAAWRVRRGRMRARVVQGIPRVAGRVGRANPAGLGGAEELCLAVVVVRAGGGDGRRRRGAAGREPRVGEVGGGEDHGSVGRAHHHRGRRVRRGGGREVDGGRVEAAAAVAFGLLQGMQAGER